jgi:Tol biopolymer transport system component
VSGKTLLWILLLGAVPVPSARAEAGPKQVTTDPGNKAHPAWSPDGRHIASTIWRYDVQFWSLSNAAGAR